MNNNDILRSIRYTFNFGDDKMIEIFALSGSEVTRTLVCEWLKQDDDEDYRPIPDILMSGFLNGFIIEKRGKKEGSKPVIETSLNNNIILRKIKIALNLKDEDLIEIMALSGMKLGKSELSAFFRNPSQSQYRPFKDQFMRNFLRGLRIKYRP